VVTCMHAPGMRVGDESVLTEAYVVELARTLDVIIPAEDVRDICSMLNDLSEKMVPVFAFIDHRDPQSELFQVQR
jgi:hypothetical protein